MASASNPQSLFNVFVYGSLLADDVVRALLKRVPPSSPAILHNFHRFSIKGCVYPAILPVENKKVNGKDSSDTLMVEAYIWADQSDPNLFGEWDFEEWERLHKQSFMKMTMEFLEELEQPNQSGSI
ncbi:AIG2-like protein D isoform X2 [Solanum verrucosum]|uniref:AIG2-like protein D isoform X2 n=1 Tax=Solanum verrucosum TaxID=315347 RepID=UPI0020D0BCD7|nr:AIG2-like protein D isoform X2 [Solanum verrucosum]